MKSVITMLSCISLVFLCQLALADTYRCNSRLVSTQSATTHEVLAKCGEPTERTFLGMKTIVNEWGHELEVRQEEWIYGPKNGMYHFLKFEDGVFIKVTSQRMQN
ncbi:DUF2845 domain-containing protein [Pseudomonas sp. F1_0610]|uniref:DUF2845 domain-containing protein n=1 Tax=Pseudomonas sp. F1_0610 TaxID=3114284 RepID=UPI0039C4C002